MTKTSRNLKGFYRQKKKIISKKSTKSTKSLSKQGSLDLHDDYNKEEKMLRQFDMNMAYGPCIGMTRMERWERAHRLGLNPPKEIKDLLLAVGKVRQTCLWDGCKVGTKIV